MKWPLVWVVLSGFIGFGIGVISASSESGDHERADAAVPAQIHQATPESATQLRPLYPENRERGAVSQRIAQLESDNEALRRKNSELESRISNSKEEIDALSGDLAALLGQGDVKAVSAENYMRYYTRTYETRNLAENDEYYRYLVNNLYSNVSSYGIPDKDKEHLLLDASISYLSALQADRRGDQSERESHARLYWDTLREVFGDNVPDGYPSIGFGGR